MKKFVFAGFSFLICLPLLANPFSANVKVTIHDKAFHLQWAKTPNEMVRGLGGVKAMAPDQGMLFVLKKKVPQWVWMKDMEFPLDILWVEGGGIVGISQNVPVKTNGQWTQVYSKVPVDQIIEVNAGTAQSLKLAPGQQVRIE